MLVTSQGTVSLSSSFPRFLSTTKKIFHTAFSLQPAFPGAKLSKSRCKRMPAKGQGWTQWTYPALICNKGSWDLGM